jgi:parvulin-like peptidyl-prolyl isomerase
MRSFVAFAALAGTLTVAGCDSFGQAMTSHTDVLARAAGHELSVDQATDLLAPATRIPAQPDVVDAIANLWMDYILLATAAVQDSTLQNVELEAIVEPFFNQQLVFKLRDQVIQVDTMIGEEELRRIFEQEQPNAEVRARHILFRMPPDASPQVRDSISGRARQVAEQARGGADFAQLAQQHTEEPGGAERGGDLGYFGPNQMVQPFEEAAFRLQPGQVSDPVETPFGLHVIKVEDKRLPNYADMRDEFHDYVVQQRVGEAEEQYLTQLTETRKLEVQEGSVDIARELAQKPGSKLSRRAAQRPLVRYTDGSLTAGEFLTLMQQRPAQQRAQVAAANDDQLREWLRLLARDEILISEARRLGLEAPQAERDSARTEIREQLRMASIEAGLLPIRPREGETTNQAMQRQVMEFLQGIINGERDVVPLGAVGFTLREQYGAELFERAIPTVVRRVEERRPATGPQGMPPGMPQELPQMPPTQMPPTQQPPTQQQPPQQ